MSTASKAGDAVAPDLAAVSEDLASLKKDFAKLIKSLETQGKRTANGFARDTIDGIEEGASEIYDRISAQGSRTAAAVNKQVEEQPAMSLAMAFAAGFIASKILTR